MCFYFCMKQGMLTLSRALSTTSHLFINSYPLLIIWDVLLDNSHGFLPHREVIY